MVPGYSSVADYINDVNPLSDDSGESETNDSNTDTSAETSN